jgi:hypothetical protein
MKTPRNTVVCIAELMDAAFLTMSNRYFSTTAAFFINAMCRRILLFRKCQKIISSQPVRISLHVILSIA